MSETSWGEDTPTPHRLPAGLWSFSRSCEGPPSSGQGAGEPDRHACQGSGLSPAVRGQGQDRVSNPKRNTRHTPCNPDSKARKTHSRPTTDSVSYENSRKNRLQNTG